MTSGAVLAERERRAAIWIDLRTRGDVNAASPELLSEVGIRPHKTGQGIYRDTIHTVGVAPHGVTLSVLDTGEAYDDAFDEAGGIYHYPSTRRAGRDEPEIEATKNAGRFGLPLFVILRGPSAHYRRVQQAWVADWDDDARAFLLSFEPHEGRATETPFRLSTSPRPRRMSAIAPRPGQARFKFLVVKRYGAKCAVCEMAVPELLEAVHICPVANEGSDDPRNGLVMCRNHHRAFDAYLFALEPGPVIWVRAHDAATLGISVPHLSHLPAVPHDDALNWRWRIWNS